MGTKRERKEMKTKKKDNVVTTKKSWNREVRQREKIEDQAKEIEEQTKKIADMIFGSQ
jgi:hypothetical protein